MDSLSKRIITRFKKVLEALQAAARLKELPEHADRDAVLLRFELVAELMPKVLKRFLAERGAAPALPKDIIRAAVSGKLLAEDLGGHLLLIIDDRNRMVHDYSERFAEDLLEKIKKGYMNDLLHMVEQLQKDNNNQILGL